jgi:hypothetical protein
MLTSAKLPSIAFLRNVSLWLSFADALAIEIAIKVAVPSDKSILFIGKLLRVLCREHANRERGSNCAHGAAFRLALQAQVIPQDLLHLCARPAHRLPSHPAQNTTGTASGTGSTTPSSEVKSGSKGQHQRAS